MASTSASLEQTVLDNHSMPTNCNKSENEKSVRFLNDRVSTLKNIDGKTHKSNTKAYASEESPTMTALTAKLEALDLHQLIPLIDSNETTHENIKQSMTESWKTDKGLKTFIKNIVQEVVEKRYIIQKNLIEEILIKRTIIILTMMLLVLLKVTTFLVANMNNNNKITGLAIIIIMGIITIVIRIINQEDNLLTIARVRIIITTTLISQSTGKYNSQPYNGYQNSHGPSSNQNAYSHNNNSNPQSYRNKDNSRQNNNYQNGPQPSKN
ncbi:uncharacterized protein EV154DRAFT_489061 [Mucor mucedo]|uniref:uncharacterized protein n=1 Tax=Mucor mucedo TaxID=29922 RepID=UPI00221E6260|nr:uncharacterized protein EV154DRAFT_489061 [Mucor mucedo]KAI7863457.1 hypothetical protein EV154DRAFT_489061 [Mucor mucedo]